MAAFDLLPHEGKVAIIGTLGHPVVRHALTHECLDLPDPPQASAWTLHFDADGVDSRCHVKEGHFQHPRFAVALTDEPDGPVVVLEESFKLQVYVDGQNEHHVQTSGQMMSLHAHIGRHTTHAVALPTGRLGAEILFDVATLAAPRHGGCLRWSLQRLYGILGLSSHSGKASHWAYKSIPRFDRSLNELGYRQHTQLHHSAQAKQPNTFLPWPAVTTAGLLCLLVKMCSSTTREGGLVQDKDKQAARELLETLLKKAVEEPLVVPMQVRRVWYEDWPAPVDQD
eukprot:5381645-Amphidinium_carterae.1